MDMITDNIDIWASAIKTRSSVGRGSSKKLDLYGIKKLRELILELAVRGKLVPQDPNDEPASVLLERIAAEKAQLVKEKKIKKPKVLPEISEDEKPYPLPLGWEMVRLGDIVSIIRGITFPASEKHKELSDGKIACLRTTNVQSGIEWGDLLYVDEKFVKRPEQKAEIGDIVMSMANSRELVGKVAYIESIPTPSATFGGFLSVIRPYEIIATFLMTILRTPHVRKVLIGSASQTTNIANISLEKLNPLLIPVPPLSEQHRIMAKVDELMALCDQLEQQTEASIDAHATLVETLLTTLTNSADAAELEQNWTRLADHFNTLFTTEQSIDQLKQTVLQLAVMGKLVPQDPNDEPAAVLLEKIAAEKAQLIKDKKIKKQKPLPPITEDEKPFPLPEGWEWERLGNLTVIKGGKRVSNGYKLLDTPTPYIYIRVADMKGGTIDDSDLKYIDEDMREKIKNYIITKDDIYMTIVGATIGKCGLVPEQFDNMNLTENAARLTPSTLLSKKYLYKILSGSFCQSQFIDKTKQVGVQKMALNRLASTLIPIPSTREANRIIVKVDQLMTLCDQLKARLQQARQTQQHLADALVEQALNV